MESNYYAGAQQHQHINSSFIMCQAAFTLKSKNILHFLLGAGLKMDDKNISPEHNAVNPFWLDPHS